MELEKVSSIAPYEVLLLKFFKQKFELFSLPAFVLEQLIFLAGGKT